MKNYAKEKCFPSLIQIYRNSEKKRKLRKLINEILKRKTKKSAELVGDFSHLFTQLFSLE